MGRSPSHSTPAENARAMGLDVGHMPFNRMAKAIPPAYSAYLFGFMVRYALKSRVGVEVPSWDEALSGLPKARREMTHLLRGAGSVNPTQGVELAAARTAVPTNQEGSNPTTSGGEKSGGDRWGKVGWTITQRAAREIELSFAGVDATRP